MGKYFKQKYDNMLKEMDEQFDEDKRNYEKIIDNVKADNNTLRSNCKKVEDDNTRLKDELKQRDTQKDDIINELRLDLDTVENTSSIAAKKVKDLEHNLENMKIVINK